MRAFSDFTAYANETAARLTVHPLIFETTRHLDATQHALFDYISDFERLREWIFGARKSWSDDTHAEAPGRVGSVRVIQPLAGPAVRETVKAFESPRMLAYSAADETFKGLCTDHLSVMTCEPHPNGGTVVCWQAYGRLPSSRAKSWLGKKLFQVALSSSMKKLEQKLSAH